MRTMRAIFTDLLPADLGMDDPCAVLLHTVARRGGSEEAVVLVDQRLAEARVAVGAGADLDPLRALQPSSIHMMHSEDPSQTEALAEALSGGAPIEIAVPHTQPEPWIIEDYGEWTPQILMNGLTITDRPEGFVSRPGRLSRHGQDLQTLTSAIGDFRARVAATPNLNTAKALRLVLDGGLTARWESRALIQAAARSGLVLSALVLRSTDAATVLGALEEAVFHSLLGRSVTLTDPSGAAVQQLPIRPGLDDLSAYVMQMAETPTRRRADDATRVTCFRALAASRFDGEHASGLESRITAVLGPINDWIAAYRRHLHTPAARVVLLPTWQCELRCVYCAIGKTDSREMDDAVGDDALDLLFSAPTHRLSLAFFGGEPLLRWPLVSRLCDAAVARAESEGRILDVQITTNAWALTEAQIIHMAKWNTHLQLSLDGDPATQNAQRKPRTGEGDSYTRGPATHLDALHRHGLDYRVIMVVSPSNVDDMVHNFGHLMKLGVRCIQLNYAIGIPWSIAATQAYAAGLAQIGETVEIHWAAGGALDFVNLREAPVSVRNNLHVTVDFDGGVYGGNAFLVQASGREKFRLGSLSDGHSWHRYMVDGKTDADVFANWKRRASVDETTRVGSVEASYVRWMQARHPDRLGVDHRRSM